MQTLRTETTTRIAGFSAILFITIFTLSAFVALAVHPTANNPFRDIINDPYLAEIIKFTLWQALLSTLLSVGFALPVARAFARQASFTGRRTILKLFALPLALPALVGVLAILGLWGKAGWVNYLIGDLINFNIFGLSGILIAHVFFNLPLATRMFLSSLETIPTENWRLASQLGMSPFSIFKLVEWPLLKTVAPGILALVFMLCLTSFTIVLTLGGGPASTTLEVAIYQSLRFDFDPGRAVTLALIQLFITALFLALSFRYTRSISNIVSLKSKISRPDAHLLQAKISDGVIIIIATCFVALPLMSLIADGLSSDLPRLLSSANVWQAIATSFALAVPAAFLSLTLCITMLKSIKNQSSPYANLVGFVSSAILVMPSIVLGSGWFIVLLSFGDVFSYAPVLVILINALMALPFVYRIISPAMFDMQQKHGRIISSLGLKGWSRWMLIDLPILRKPLTLAFAFAMAISIGDLGVIALFGSEQITTLPLLLFKSLGSYRTQDAQGLSLLLTALCFLVFLIAEKSSGKKV